MQKHWERNPIRQKGFQNGTEESSVLAAAAGGGEICYCQCSVGEKLTEAREERERKGGGSFHGRRAPTTGKKRENMERAQRMDGGRARAPLQKED